MRLTFFLVRVDRIPPSQHMGSLQPREVPKVINSVFAVEAVCAMAPTSAALGYPSALGTVVAGTRRRTRLIGTNLGIASRT
jgi:hypothetical protein